MGAEGAAASNPPEPGPSVAASPARQPEPEPEAKPSEPSLPPLPPGPVLTDGAERGHARAQAKLLRSDERLPPLNSVPPELEQARAVALGLVAPPVPADPDVPAASESGSDDAPTDASAGEPASAAESADSEAPPPSVMPGNFVPITPPAADVEPLSQFYTALGALRAGEDPDGKVRVAMYGASGTAADLAVGYMRTYLQARFGDGGPGFVPLAPLSRWYRHSEVKVEASKGWRKEHAQRRDGRLDGHYGLLGASFAATKAKRWSTVAPKKRSVSALEIATIEVLFLRQPEGGAFRLRVDDGDPVVIETAADSVQPGYHRVEVEPGPHRIRVETVSDAEVRVFGVVLEREDPGVVVDVLGIDGTRGANHLAWNEALWADNIKRRAPDLYTLSYGTNESVDDDMSIAMYAEDLRAQLRRFARVLPDASCLLIGPVDFPIREDDTLRVRPLLRDIIAVQHRVAAEEGCGFWDGVAFMGGDLSMGTWVQSDPPLARGDHLHFTLRGATRKGMALADALMHGFDGRFAATISQE